MNNTFPKKLSHWPTHWSGGSPSYKIGNESVVWISAEDGPTRLLVHPSTAKYTREADVEFAKEVVTRWNAYEGLMTTANEKQDEINSLRIRIENQATTILGLQKSVSNSVSTEIRLRNETAGLQKEVTRLADKCDDREKTNAANERLILMLQSELVRLGQKLEKVQAASKELINDANIGYTRGWKMPD